MNKLTKENKITKENKLMIELTSDRVHDTFLYCLFETGEDHTGYKEGVGVKFRIGFHPVRLGSKRQQISEMLTQLPDQFMESKGGGWSFLNFCTDKNGQTWTDFHTVCDELICLGNALGLCKALSPELASIMPGGVPYIVVHDKLIEL